MMWSMLLGTSASMRVHQDEGPKGRTFSGPFEDNSKLYKDAKPCRLKGSYMLKLQSKACPRAHHMLWVRS